MPSRHTPDPHSRHEVASQVAAQFKHSRFTHAQHLIDQAFMKHVDRAPCVSFKQFRDVAKREG
jgi:hypothetical protein